MNRDTVLKAYLQGDADQRMSLFLSFRELRDAFSMIELGDPEDQPASCCAS